MAKHRSVISVREANIKDMTFLYRWAKVKAFPNPTWTGRIIYEERPIVQPIAVTKTKDGYR